MPEIKNAKNPVKFGVEKCYYAVIGEDGSFGKPKPLRGAVSNTVTPEGQSNKFYADNSIYASFDTNSGFSGKLEIAYLEEEAEADLLGTKKAANGIVYDDAEAQPGDVALLWQTNGNVRNKRVAYYAVNFSRPEDAANTTQDTTDPDTITLDYTARVVEMEVDGKTVKLSKGSMASDDAEHRAVYDKWFEEVQVPSASADAA